MEKHTVIVTDHDILMQLIEIPYFQTVHIFWTNKLFKHFTKINNTKLVLYRQKVTVNSNIIRN